MCFSYVCPLFVSFFGLPMLLFATVACHSFSSPVISSPHRGVERRVGLTTLLGLLRTKAKGLVGLGSRVRLP